ncbi:U-box domain-containing protein 2-like [Rhodamnia argentea]|uniref:U-box domain-containing protein 2-like n=1 Tax=Rhodamnia argentea TaxID=178133 RepID=A0A8B8PYG9_9MYRT|nr:U-box domain-containing protein 2-like [Rhodamnia argentea]
MAETEDPDGGPAKSPQELKSKVSRLLEMIAKEDECKLETVDEGISGGPLKIAKPTFRNKAVDNPGLEEDLTAIVLNLSIVDGNKELMEGNPFVISFLVGSLNSRTHRTRSIAAAALSKLLVLDSNRRLIGEAGAIGPLINVVRVGSILAIFNAASALFQLFHLTENVTNAIRARATSVILQRLEKRTCMDELVGLLVKLSGDQDTVEELRDIGDVPILLKVLGESIPERCKENCVVILEEICSYYPNTAKQIRNNWDACGLLFTLSTSSTATARAQRKATSIVKRIMNAAS